MTPRHLVILAGLAAGCAVAGAHLAARWADRAASELIHPAAGPIDPQAHP